MFVASREVTTSTRKPKKSMVKDAFRTGYQIAALPHQKYGILSALLWPSKEQVIRIVPGYDKATGELYRQNIRVNEYSVDDDMSNYLSGTFCQATVIARFGNITSPFITDYEPGSPDERQWGGNTVIHGFARAIINATAPKTDKKASRSNTLKPIDEWFNWTGIGPNAKLGFDKQSLLMQALVFTLNGRDNIDLDTEEPLVDSDGDILPFMAVVAVDNKQSIHNIEAALVEPINPGKPLDAATNNKYGAMAEAAGNIMYLHSYKDAQTGRNALRPSVQAATTGWTPKPFDLDDDVIRQLWHPWDELLNYMTAQEQIELCAQEFEADTVNYVLGSNPMWRELEIPDNIRRVGLGRYASRTVVPAPDMNAQPTARQGSALKLGQRRDVSGRTVDTIPPATDKVQDTLKRIKEAAAAKQQAQSSAAASLLDGMDEIDLFDGKAEIDG